MQKKTPTYIYIQLLFLIFSCYSCMPEKVPNPMLLRADSLMECCADSALVVLDSIEQPQKMKKSEQAFYALLRTKADDKNYVVHNSDSLIRVAVDYYENRNDEDKKAEAYFYLGSVYRDMGMKIEEIEAFQKALRAKGKKEDRMAALICNNLSSLYREQDFFDEALTMAKEAYTISLRLDNQLDIVHFTRNLGYSYQFLEKQDSALFYYKEALGKINTTTDGWLEELLYTDIGEIYIKMSLTDSAYCYLSEFMQILPKENISFSALHAIGKIHHYMGQQDSARIYLTLCLNADNIYMRASSRLILSKIEEESGNLQKSIQYKDEYLALNDTIDAGLRRKETSALINKHALGNIKEKKNSHTTGTSLFIIILLSIAFAGWYLFNKKRKSQQKKRGLDNPPIAHLSVNGGIYSVVCKNSDLFKQCVMSLKSTSHYDMLMVLYKNPKNRDVKISNIRDAFKEDIINSFSEIINALSEYFSQLSNDDLYCCILYLLEFKSSAVETIMGISNDALRKRRSRIKRVIGNELHIYIFRSN